MNPATTLIVFVHSYLSIVFTLQLVSTRHCLPSDERPPSLVLSSAAITTSSPPLALGKQRLWLRLLTELHAAAGPTTAAAVASRQCWKTGAVTTWHSLSVYERFALAVVRKLALFHNGDYVCCCLLIISCTWFCFADKIEYNMFIVYHSIYFPVNSRIRKI